MSEHGLSQEALAALKAGQWETAGALLRRALQREPGNVSILNNLGAALDQLGRTKEAIGCYREAAERSPAQAVPHYNFGEALLRAGKAVEAVAPLRAAATLDPDLQPAWAALGAALLAREQPAAALGALRRAVQLGGAGGESWCRLGDALQSLRRFEECIPCYEQATRHTPGQAAPWYGLGRALLACERAVEAVRAFGTCLRLDPDCAAAVHEQGKALFQLGCVEAAMPLLRRAAEVGPEDVRQRARENLAIIVPGSPDDDNRSVQATRRAWAGRLPSRSAPRPRDRQGAPLRIGYVSAFFHRPNWMKPVWALINRHDRSRFQVHLFSDAPAASVSGYRPQAGDQFHDITGLSNEKAAEVIVRQGVDLLIDLNGFSAAQRLALFALRPAPLQVGWFNLYATSGLDGLDYLIGDEHVLPPAEEAFYAERIVRVPGSYLTFEVDHPVPDVVPPPVLGAGRLTIGCLASQYKITEQVVQTWAEVLRRCPDARLLIRNATLGRAEHPEHLRGRFAAQGIAGDRLQLEGPGEHLDFLRTYDRIDFALDPFPYSGGTTTTEALWQGVPVLTFAGDRWASRTSLSLLRAAGLDEFVARDRAEYVETAVRLATAADTPTRLAEWRAGLRERLRRSPVCDAAGFTRAMEACYLALWQERLGGRPA